MFDDRFAEGDAFSRIGERRVESGLPNADGLRSNADTSAVQRRKRDPKSLSGQPEHVLGSDLEPVEQDLTGVVAAMAEFLLAPHHAIAGLMGAREEAARAGLTGARIGPRDDHGQTCGIPCRDEGLCATEDVAAVCEFGMRLYVCCIRTSLGLCEQEGSVHLAAGGRAKEGSPSASRCRTRGRRRSRANSSPP